MHLEDTAFREGCETSLSQAGPESVGEGASVTIWKDYGVLGGGCMKQRVAGRKLGMRILVLFQIGTVRRSLGGGDWYRRA